MPDENGGELKVGARLQRIEDRLDSIESHLNERVTRHREANEHLIKELSSFVTNDIGGRVAVLEKHDVAEAAVRSYRKWLIGVGVVGVGGLLLNLAIALQVLGRV